MKHLVNNIRRYVRLYAKLVSFSLQSAMAYRGDFFASLLSVFTDLGVRIAFPTIVYRYLPEIQGWTYSDLLFLMGTGFLIEAGSWFTWRASLTKIHESIRDGTFDFLITKPIGLLFYSSMRRIDLEDAGRIVVAVLLFLSAIHLRGALPSLEQWLYWFVLLITGSIVYFSFAVILKSTSFWLTQTQEINYLIYTFERLKLYPVQFYKGAARLFFTIVFPVAFITTIPVQLLTGKASRWWMLIAIGFTICFFSFARWLFYRGVRAYASVG